jgi:hypothetical protein
MKSLNREMPHVSLSKSALLGYLNFKKLKTENVRSRVTRYPFQISLAVFIVKTRRNFQRPRDFQRAKSALNGRRSLKIANLNLNSPFFKCRAGKHFSELINSAVTIYTYSRCLFFLEHDCLDMTIMCEKDDASKQNHDG